MENYDIENEDGTYGRKLFYEARGYTVTDCYTQKTDNVFSGGFSFAQYMAEIDAGRPVLLNLVGHSIVGVGYDDSSNTVYIHNTWDNTYHTMTWGGTYSGMALRSVSIVNLLETTTDISEISVSPNPYDFGNVNILHTPTQTFTISNIGTGNLIIGTIIIGGDRASGFSLYGDNCSGQTLVPSQMCTLGVTFTPTAYGGQSSILEIPSSDPISPTVKVTLSGTVVYEATPSYLEGTLGTEITYAGAPYSFGTKKGKVLIGGLKQKVGTWSDTSIKFIVKKVPLPAEEAYDIAIQPKRIGAPSIDIPWTFTVRKPQIDPFTSDTQGAPGADVTIRGLWFGSKKGKVYIGNQKCKVKSWDMVPATGVSTIVFELHEKVAAGIYDLEVENRVGSSLPFSFNVGPVTASP